MLVNRTSLIAICLAAAICLGVLAGGLTAALAQETPPTPEPSAAPAAASAVLDAKSVYLPVAFKSFPRSASIFGVETYHLNLAWRIGSTGTYWLRHFTVDWSKVEPVKSDPAVYDWSAIDEAGLSLAYSNQTAIIATVKFTPAWAQKYPGVLCGPPSEAALDRYAQFLQALVRRYSAAPYFIRYWEIGNEVDIDYHFPPTSPFGCWGDSADAYYGGGYYATVLKKIYPAIKAADPQAQVLLGGLLLDCDPANPPPNKTCTSGKYLEGILKNDGGPYFDMVSYHSYAYYNNGKIDENLPTWATRGGMFLGKIKFLRETLAASSVSKPILLSEMSLLCPENAPGCNPVSDEFKDVQADYIYWVYLRAWGEGLKGAIWFTFEDSGWRSSGLYGDGGPKPAFYAYQYLSTALDGASLTGPLAQFPGLAGYALDRNSGHIWVLWSADQVPHTITLPAGVLSIHDKLGKPLPRTATLTIKSPVLIELGP